MSGIWTYCRRKLPATSSTKFAAWCECECASIHPYPIPGTSATTTISANHASESAYAASKAQHRYSRTSGDTSNPNPTAPELIKLLGAVLVGQETTQTDATINESKMVDDKVMAYQWVKHMMIH